MTNEPPAAADEAPVKDRLPVTPANTSGTLAPVPEEIKGWNWGAFWLSWIWGIGNGVWLGLLGLVLVGVWNVVLGARGNEWVWQSRKFESVEHFREVQRAWSRWGWIIGLVTLLGAALTALIVWWLARMAINSGSL